MPGGSVVSRETSMTLKLMPILENGDSPHSDGVRATLSGVARGEEGGISRRSGLYGIASQSETTWPTSRLHYGLVNGVCSGYPE